MHTFIKKCFFWSFGHRFLDSSQMASERNFQNNLKPKNQAPTKSISRMKIGNWTLFVFISCKVREIGPNHLIQRTSCRTSTGRPVGFYWTLELCKFASNVLELLISSRNEIKISTRCPVEFLLDVPQNLLDIQWNCSKGRPLEQKIWRYINTATFCRFSLCHILFKLMMMPNPENKICTFFPILTHCVLIFLVVAALSCSRFFPTHLF